MFTSKCSIQSISSESITLRLFYKFTVVIKCLKHTTTLEVGGYNEFLLCFHKYKSRMALKIFNAFPLFPIKVKHIIIRTIFNMKSVRRFGVPCMKKKPKYAVYTCSIEVYEKRRRRRKSYKFNSLYHVSMSSLRFSSMFVCIYTTTTTTT